MSMRLGKIGLFSLSVLNLLLISVHDNSANACGADTDCVVQDNRTYRIRMPEGHDGASSIGAIFFMHGYRGSAKGVMRNKSLGKAVSDLGLALVAPKSAFEDWAIPGAPSGHVPVELEYFDAVVADIKDRFNIDTTRMMASGFSAGGMMTWNLICNRGTLFAGYAPISGTFWEPTPQTCTTPSQSVIHTHGEADRVVPIEGRPIGPTKQGDLRAVIAMYKNYGLFMGANKTEEKSLDLKCTPAKMMMGRYWSFACTRAATA